jgi:hypothetical protein
VRTSGGVEVKTSGGVEGTGGSGRGRLGCVHWNKMSSNNIMINIINISI